MQFLSPGRCGDSSAVSWVGPSLCWAGCSPLGAQPGLELVSLWQLSGHCCGTAEQQEGQHCWWDSHIPNPTPQPSPGEWEAGEVGTIMPLLPGVTEQCNISICCQYCPDPVNQALVPKSF